MAYKNDIHDEYVAAHTIHMRKALNYCELLFQQKCDKIDRQIHNLEQPQIVINRDLIRDEEMRRFENIYKTSNSIPVVHIDDVTTSEFRKKFQMGNIPCLVLGLDSKEFRSVTRKWRTENGCINQKWFMDTVGENTTILLRKETAGLMDKEGRAQECEEMKSSMKQWILTSQYQPELYLKDWHLIKYLQKRGIKEDLYKVPNIFQPDLLNSFLILTTDGDYKFTYWGGAGSHTPIHSDVLNSFSWSYNVIGLKKWKFYVPQSRRSIVVEQHAGECIFVPSGWKHEVTNVVETISINHNWVTIANIDLLYKCIMQELKFVELECSEWGIKDFEARESMLRGCAGLDITAFFFLLMTSLLDFLVRPLDEETINFDVAELVALIQELMNNSKLNLGSRLSAVLCCDESKERSLNLASILISKVNFTS